MPTEFAGYAVDHTVTAHSGGLAALDARGNFVATCGYSMRLGRVSQDSMVKVRPQLSSPACKVALLELGMRHAGTELFSKSAVKS